MDNISNKWSFKVYRKSHLSSTSWKRMWGRWWRNQVRFSQKRLVGIQKRTYNSFSCLCNFCSFAWCKSTEDLASRIANQRLRRTGVFLSPIGFCLYPCCCWKVWDEGSPNQCWRSEVCQWLPFFSLCHQKDGLLSANKLFFSHGFCFHNQMPPVIFLLKPHLIKLTIFPEPFSQTSYFTHHWLPRTCTSAFLSFDEGD